MDENFKKLEKKIDGLTENSKRLEVLIDGLAIATKNGFDDVNKKIDNFKTETEENFKKIRKDILDVGDRFVPRFEFDNLLIRFNKLEQIVREKVK